MELACTELRVAGTRPKDLPWSPRAQKPKPVLEELPAGNQNDVEGSDSATSDNE